MFTSILSLMTTLAFANTSSLDNKSFCRTFISDGFFGQPSGERQHCLSFSKGHVVDTANTAFGRPPESFQYTVNDNRVLFESAEYTLSEDQTVLTTVTGSTVPGTQFQLVVE